MSYVLQLHVISAKGNETPSWKGNDKKSEFLVWSQPPTYLPMSVWCFYKTRQVLSPELPVCIIPIPNSTLCLSPPTELLTKKCVWYLCHCCLKSMSDFVILTDGVPFIHVDFWNNGVNVNEKLFPKNKKRSFNHYRWNGRLTVKW